MSRGLSGALLIADLPFQSYATPERALDASAPMLAAGGASMVKLEGAGPMLEMIRFLVEREIPVCAHLGLTPQSVLRLGGYKVQGREQAAAARLLADAEAVAEAGAELLVLECVPSALAGEITADWRFRPSASAPARPAMARSWCCTTCWASTPVIAGRAS